MKATYESTVSLIESLLLCVKHKSHKALVYTKFSIVSLTEYRETIITVRSISQSVEIKQHSHIAEFADSKKVFKFKNTNLTTIHAYVGTTIRDYQPHGNFVGHIRATMCDSPYVNNTQDVMDKYGYYSATELLMTLAVHVDAHAIKPFYFNVLVLENGHIQLLLGFMNTNFEVVARLLGYPTLGIMARTLRTLGGKVVIKHKNMSITF